MAIAGGLFLWGRHYLTGVERVDRQHEEITVLLNELYDAHRDGVSKDRQIFLFDALIEAVAAHFRTEESYMRELGYEERDFHEREHDALASKVMSLREEFGEGRVVSIEGGLEFVKEWLRDHMMTSDRRMGRFLAQRMGIEQV